ncbi:hypothetical protein JTB14_024899 [Gonioctena quinquepunctata]|nr:hypothetical protein JTB14_024899 [Gonioctena quinquepunctata]
MCQAEITPQDQTTGESTSNSLEFTIDPTSFVSIALSSTGVDEAYSWQNYEKPSDYRLMNEETLDLAPAIGLNGMDRQVVQALGQDL